MAGVLENNRSASNQTTATVTSATRNDAWPKPRRSMATTHNGENTTPPMLAPLYAVASAMGRLRSNQGDRIALMAAALMDTQPAPLRSVAANRCHGSCAHAQPHTPNTAAIVPALVMAGTPKRR